MSGELPLMDPVSAAASERAAASNWYDWSDWVGMVASIGCAIHCAAMPFVITYLPALGLSFLADEAFHKWIAIGCFAIALAAFVPGLRKHGRLSPVIAGGVGLAMISIAAFGFAGECCTACKSDIASVGVVLPDAKGQVAPSISSDSCTDDCCPQCDRETSGTDPEDAVSARIAFSTVPALSSPATALGNRIAPWLTPLGGIVLVTAHLLNRRYGCLCGCCENESVSGIA